QYRLFIYVTVDVGFQLSTEAGAAGLYYYVRVNNNGDSITPIDTTGQSTGGNRARFYGTETAVCLSGINGVASPISTISIVPNPMTSQALVNFFSNDGGIMTEKLTNAIGEVVYTNEISVVPGNNTHTIQRGSLATGVYLYTITDGKSVTA